jgi:regulator of replication initiation timing
MHRPLLRLYFSVRVASFVSQARNDIDRLCADHRRQINTLLSEFAEQERNITALMHDNIDLREELKRLRAVCRDAMVLLRERADQDVATLRRQLEAALLRLAVRDPNAAFN